MGTQLTHLVIRHIKFGVFWRITIRVPIGLAILLGLMFGSAGRWDVPQFWAYIALLLGVLIAVVCLLDRELLKERARPGAGGTDRRLPWLIIPFFLGHLIIAGLDAGRYGWSGTVPIAVPIAGLAGVGLSLALSIWSMRVNRFYSPVVRIQSERGHSVITSGPYRFVRHPGYTASLVLTVCQGPALGSYWSMLPLIPSIAMIFRRTIIEDRYLHANLQGYAEYAQRVRWRLAPRLW